MSHQKVMLRAIAEAINAGGPFHVETWFTEDFRLSEPTRPNWPTGHVGAKQMLDLFKSLSQPVKLEPLDMIEEGDRIAVRWRLRAVYNDAPLHRAMLAIYRFENGRIAEDWGIPIQGDWP